MNKRIRIALLFFFLFTGPIATVVAANYDLVILNGRVMDPESKLDAVRNVGIRDGKIAVISKDKMTGREQIDASGHVVAPGFVDGHSHVVDVPLGQRLALRDGVTTTLDLEVGALPVSRWYDKMKGKSQTNYGASVSVMGARAATFDPDYLKASSGGTSYDLVAGKVWITPTVWWRAPTDKQIDNILKLIDQGLKEGGLGIGPPTGYMVNGLTSQEMIGAQKLAGKYGRFSHVHTRFSSQMSYQYADFLAKNGVWQMANKGRIKVGADADITIFDPQTVRDNSSLDQGKNAQPTTGIPYVIVNGTIVVKDSKVLKDVYPGKPVRAAMVD